MKKMRNYYIENEQIEKLREIKRKTGMPYAETIRRALNLYFIKYRIGEKNGGK
jgi:hypothetical protein